MLFRFIHQLVDVTAHTLTSVLHSTVDSVIQVVSTAAQWVTTTLDHVYWFFFGTRHSSRKSDNSWQPLTTTESFDLPCLCLDESEDENEYPDDDTVENETNDHASPPKPFHTSSSPFSRTTFFRPSTWPQAPLFLLPGPGTRVKGVRLSHSSTYLWTPAQHGDWYDAWHSPDSSEPGVAADTPRSNTSSTSNYMACTDSTTTTTPPPNASTDPPETTTPYYSLPINNGHEPHDGVLVTDFSTNLFEGTLLLRIRHSRGLTKSKSPKEASSFFAGKNRQYQAVIRGRFLRPVSWSHCTTGLVLPHGCGRLPPRWIVATAVSILSIFAPQVHTCLNGPACHILTPLGSTPQSITVQPRGSNAAAAFDITTALSEPKSKEALVSTSSSLSSRDRARRRKQVMDQLFLNQFADHSSSRQQMTDTNKIYTFEFLQHLIDFETFSLQLKGLKRIRLIELLNQQPLQIMAQYHTTNCATIDALVSSPGQPLWSFELWHQDLIDTKQTH